MPFKITKEYISMNEEEPEVDDQVVMLFDGIIELEESIGYRGENGKYHVVLNGEFAEWPKEKIFGWRQVNLDVDNPERVKQLIESGALS